MNLGRAVLAGTGVLLCLGAAAATLAGLIGAVWGWPDALNSFVPVWLVAAWVGALLTRLTLPAGWRRTGVLLLAAVAVAVAGLPVGLEAIRAMREPQGGQATLTLLTFNRWWDTREPALQAAMIRGSGADLVAVQEANRFRPVAATLKDVYPYQLFCGGSCDTVLLSKRRFVARDMDANMRDPAWGEFLWAQLEAPDGRMVTVATVHTFWPVPPWIQRFQRRHIAELAQTLRRDQLIVLGDFNLTPWSFAMRALDRDMRPLTRRTHGLPTFSARWPISLLALDQVYAGASWKTVEIRRLPYAGSDHYPLLVRLRR